MRYKCKIFKCLFPIVYEIRKKEKICRFTESSIKTFNLTWHRLYDTCSKQTHGDQPGPVIMRRWSFEWMAGNADAVISHLSAGCWAQCVGAFYRNWGVTTNQRRVFIASDQWGCSIPSLCLPGVWRCSSSTSDSRHRPGNMQWTNLLQMDPELI